MQRPFCPFIKAFFDNIQLKLQISPFQTVSDRFRRVQTSLDVSDAEMNFFQATSANFLHVQKMEEMLQVSMLLLLYFLSLSSSFCSCPGWAFSILHVQISRHDLAKFPFLLCLATQRRGQQQKRQKLQVWNKIRFLSVWE